MNILTIGTKLILVLCLTAVWLRPAFAAENNPSLNNPRTDIQDTDPVIVANEYPAFTLGTCKITVLKTYLWRDWMPVVDQPGSDKGSPLHSKIQLNLDNSAGGGIKLSYQGVVISSKGQSFAVTFTVLPNYRLIPESIDNPESWQTMDETARKAVIAKYNVLWTGELKPGETRKVELLSADGPYLPGGDIATVEITLTDQKGRSVVVKSPSTLIHKTY
jgi:hypothetical protein